MNWRLPLTLALLLGAIATGWSVWRMSHPADDGVLRTRPDYVLRDYEITALDKQGKESFTLRGPVLQRDPANRTMTLATPRFLVPDRLGRYWNVVAQQGFVPADGGQLELRGQVRADSPADAPPPTRIETDWLALDLERNRARSTAAVTVTRPGLTMRGTGLEADFDASRSRFSRRYAPTMSRTTEFAATVLALALLAAGTAVARTSDRNQPMDIEAARSDCGLGENATCTFSGQATITQGSLRIAAEKAVVTQVAGKPSRAQFSGGVQLQQDMDDGDHIDARSNSVDYDMRNEVIVFTGNVSIAQRRGSLSGERVVYNLKTGQLESGGGTGGGRVKMRILPKQAQPAQDSGKGTP